MLNNGILTADGGGLFLSEIQDALGAGRSVTLGDLGTDRAGAVLRKNKWSRLQPFIHSTRYTDRFKASGSQRLAGLKARNWGWGTGGIPSYANWSALRAALVAGITPGNLWKRESMGVSNLVEVGDFDGYATSAKLLSEWGPLGPSDNKHLYFPFAGLISIYRDDYVIYTDTVDIVMDGYDPDAGATGLLYLSDFAAMAAVNPSYYSYIDWYLGILLVKQGLAASDSSGAYLVNTGNTIAEFTADNAPALNGVPFSIGSAGSEIPAGDYYLYPVLCSRNLSQVFVQITSGWGGESQGPGRVVLLDGYRLPVKIEPASTHPDRFALTVSYGVSVSGSTTTVTVTVRNMTNSAITVYANQFFCYVVAEKIFDDQYADYMTYVYDPAEAWVQSGSDTYKSDRRNASNVVIGRYYDLYSLFYAANGNSNVIASGVERSFSFTINSATDAQGFPYNPWTMVELMYGYALSGQTYRRRHQ